MAEIYRQRIAVLYGSPQNEDVRAEAAEVFRTPIEKLTLVPDAEDLAIVLRGDLYGDGIAFSRGGFRLTIVSLRSQEIEHHAAGHLAVLEAIEDVVDVRKRL